jgi:hypothetical protein
VGRVAASKDISAPNEGVYIIQLEDGQPYSLELKEQYPEILYCMSTQTRDVKLYSQNTINRIL